jgi:hypothetical protein
MLADLRAGVDVEQPDILQQLPQASNTPAGTAARRDSDRLFITCSLRLPVKMLDKAESF